MHSVGKFAYTTFMHNTQKNHVGERSLAFPNQPHIVSAACIAGPLEGKGPLQNLFDIVLADDKLGEDSFERAEQVMFENTVRLAISKAGLETADIQCLLAGDLLNQIITANFSARNLQIPLLGLYSACSTMSESILLGACLVDGGYATPVACAACSHFSTAERQYRLPLEMGSTAPEYSQRTVTGAGCVLLSNRLPPKAKYRHCVVTGATIGRVIDLGITDSCNMGAAMAPAACDAIVTHLKDYQRTANDYDWIVTGDLGKFGTEMLFSLTKEQGTDLSGRHIDCGNMIFTANEKNSAGGSGCGCSATVLTARLLNDLESGCVRRVLFLATGALLSPTASLQGESIPSIAHAVILEYSEG